MKRLIVLWFQHETNQLSEKIRERSLSNPLKSEAQPKEKYSDL